MRFLFCAAPVLLLTAAVFGQTTQPVADNSTVNAAMEMRAGQAFNKGDYAQALPMLQKLETALANDPSRSDKAAMVKEQIRVCEKNVQVTSAVTSTGDTSPVPPMPAQPAMTTADRKPHIAPKSGEVMEMTIKELGNFEYDPEQNTPIPDDVKALSGSMIRLHGYMIPMDQAESISRFALVPSVFACCFGQPPQVQHTILVTCPKGKAISYTPDEIVVEGKLKVDVTKEDGFVVGIFAIETTSVKMAPK